uniref:Uncharacterized protein n=1 Tax=Helianthus annuus TaxID=4232 RepID=A0A251VEW4_HELAN
MISITELISISGSVTPESKPKVVMAEIYTEEWAEGCNGDSAVPSPSRSDHHDS